jgi:hypothetical protein
MEKYLINFSGHALSKQAKETLLSEFSEIDEVYIETISFEKDVEEQIKLVMSHVKFKLDGSVPISVILPGQATIAVLMISYLHGIIGSFPNVCLLEESDEGIYLPTNIFTISNNKLKKAGRVFRQELWNKYRNKGI